MPRIAKPAEQQTRADRKNRSAEEPKHEKGLPLPPDDLDDAAKREWFRLIATLDTNMLSTADRNALALYCTLWAQWEACQVVIQRDGLIRHLVTDKGDYEMIRSEVTLSLKLVAEMNKLSAKFGLTPSDRASIGIARTEKKTSNERKVEKFGLRRVK